MVSETDAKAKEKSSNDEHNEVDGEAVESNSDQEDEGGKLHGELAAVRAANSGCNKTGQESSEVERRREQLEALVVVLAVVVLVHLVLFQVH